MEVLSEIQETINIRHKASYEINKDIQHRWRTIQPTLKTQDSPVTFHLEPTRVGL